MLDERKPEEATFLIVSGVTATRGKSAIRTQGAPASKSLAIGVARCPTCHDSLGQTAFMISLFHLMNSYFSGIASFLMHGQGIRSLYSK